MWDTAAVSRHRPFTDFEKHDPAGQAQKADANTRETHALAVVAFNTQ
jgi:hypothetical protein